MGRTCGRLHESRRRPGPLPRRQGWLPKWVVRPLVIEKYSARHTRPQVKADHFTPASPFMSFNSASENRPVDRGSLNPSVVNQHSGSGSADSASNQAAM